MMTEQKNFEFTELPEMRFSPSNERPVLVGHEALNLHHSEEY